MARGIFFQELSTEFSEWLDDLRDPTLLRFADALPAAVSERIRQEHVKRLRLNIELLRAKQSEFHARVEEYIEQLEGLRRRLESTPAAPPEPSAHSGVVVRCGACERESVFESFEMLFARESEDSLTRPTECYVQDHGEIKKGVFFCESCGAESLTIRAVARH